nr:hypothetical protein DA06_25530 [Georgenia sp. SUBG003]
MQPLGQPALAEDPQAQEGGLEEEGGERLDRERAPKMSPTKREYSDQFMPNWNSCTMPVATPSAKLMSRTLPKNFVSRCHFSSPVRTHAVCMIATRGDSPIVRGTRMKWYTVVMPNCHRARSSAST